MTEHTWHDTIDEAGWHGDAYRRQQEKAEQRELMDQTRNELSRAYYSPETMETALDTLVDVFEDCQRLKADGGMMNDSVADHFLKIIAQGMRVSDVV